MDLPLGASLREGLKTGESDLHQIMTNMVRNEFSGYLICTIEGPTGIEQGALLFKKGNTVGAYYEFISQAVEVSGDSAVRLVLNSFAAKNGVIDINTLSIQQIDLITAFQEKILTSEGIDEKRLARLYPKQFDSGLASQYVKKESAEASRFELFKRSGLLGVEGK